MQRYKGNAKGFLKNPLENEEEWDKIFRSGYATGNKSYTPASIGKSAEEDLPVDGEDDEESADSEDVVEIVETPNTNVEPFVVEIEPKKRKSLDSNKSILSKKSSKSSREEDIDACLNQMRKSSLSQSSKQQNAFDDVLNKLESLGIAAKYGEEFVVDILDIFRVTPGAIDLFNALRSDVGRLHFLRKHCGLEDDVYKPVMPTDGEFSFGE